MKLPTEDELSEEQREVCAAKLDTTTLVSGPPGSGKSVVAIMRYKALQKLMEGKVLTLSYNQVLKVFMGFDNTFESWMIEIWQEAFPNKKEFPYNKSDNNDFKTIDWMKYHQVIKENPKNFSKAICWKHIILDEAQDFSKYTHAALDQFSKLQLSQANGNNGLTYTILADENQRITKDSSKLKDIRYTHAIMKEDEYNLTLNYRNTKEIADLAKCFYVELETGIPKSPTRHGNKPELIKIKNYKNLIEQISRWCSLHSNESVGILVMYNNQRSKIFTELENKKTIDVQTYSSKGGKVKSKILNFDKPGKVTVLCYASAKGVEFDTVMMPFLDEIKIDGISEASCKMNFYVMMSRARKNLIMYAADLSRNACALLTSNSKIKEKIDVKHTN